MLPLAERRALKAVFLCGGVGRRMFPVTEEKCLLTLLGRTLLEHQIERMAQAGVRDFLVIAGPGAQQRVAEAVGRLNGVSVQVALQEQPRGMGHALLSAREHLGTGPVLLVSPSEIVEPTAYDRMLSAFREGNAASYLLGYEVKLYFPDRWSVLFDGRTSSETWGKVPRNRQRLGWAGSPKPSEERCSGAL